LDDIAIPVLDDFDGVVLTPVTAQPTKPRVWTVFAAVGAALGVAVVLQIVIATMLVVVEAARGGDIQQISKDLPVKIATPGIFILLASGGQLAFLIGALLPAWLSRVSMKQRLGLFWPRPSWGIVPMAMIASWASLGVGSAVATWLALYVEPSTFFDELYENVTLSEAIPFVLFMAIVPGIVEELLFRGYIQRRLLERWSPALAITVTSALFALVHLQLHHVVAVFPMGLWLGVVAWKTGSVIPSMFCHAFINGTAVAWVMIVKFGGVSEDTEKVVYIVAILGGLACFMFSVNYFIKDERSAGAGG